MRTVLQSSAEIFEISVFAEIAVWEKRPELQRLLAAAATSGKVDAAVVSSALPGLSDSANRNLICALEQMKLVEAGGIISAFGRRCAETGEATAWELGVFTFLVAKHACFGAWPIAFRRERADGHDREFRNLEEVPDWFKADPKRIWTSGFADKQRFTISRFPGVVGKGVYCRVEQRPAAAFHWELDLRTGKNAMHVAGEIVAGEGRTPYRTNDMALPTDEVLSYFGSWESRWNSSAGRVLMPYDGTARDGTDTFVRSLSVGRVTVGARGTFDAVTVEGVPVGPADASQAREWALALVVGRIRADDRYVSRSALPAKWSEVVAATPLEANAGAPPDALELLNHKARLNTRVRWLVATGFDLALE